MTGALGEKNCSRFQCPFSRSRVYEIRRSALGSVGGFNVGVVHVLDKSVQMKGGWILKEKVQ